MLGNKFVIGEMSSGLTPLVARVLRRNRIIGCPPPRALVIAVPGV